MNINSSLKNKINQYLQDDGMLKLNRYNNVESYNECKKWFNFIKYYNKGILKAEEYKLNVGRWYGIFPIYIGDDHIKFSIDYYESSSWKDWFIIN